MTWLAVTMASGFLLCLLLAGLVFFRVLGGPAGLRRALQSLRR